MLLHAVKVGAVLAVTKVALLSIAQGAFGVPALTNPATGLAMWFAAFGVLVGGAWQLKKRAGGYQRFTTVLLHLCLAWTVGQALFTGYSILLFNVLSPGLLEATVEPMREIARKLGERAELPGEQIEAHAMSITASTSPFSVAGQLRGLRDGLFPGIVLSLVIAIPFRARPQASEGEATAPPSTL